jgi:hypothetical protein
VTQETSWEKLPSAAEETAHETTADEVGADLDAGDLDLPVESNEAESTGVTLDPSDGGIEARSAIDDGGRMLPCVIVILCLMLLCFAMGGIRFFIRCM